MANDTSIRFTLNNDTLVIVKKVLNNKYDFELILPNGSRKTFIWADKSDYNYSDRKGNVDRIAAEAIQHFMAIPNK